MVTRLLFPTWILIAIVTVSTAQSTNGTQGISDTELLASVPNAPAPWINPFAAVDVTEQQNLDWGPVPKPNEPGVSQTDVQHAIEGLFGTLDGVDQNTHDANHAHFIDFFLQTGEFPPNLEDQIGDVLSPQGLPDMVGTGLGSPNDNINVPITNGLDQSLPTKGGNEGQGQGEPIRMHTESPHETTTAIVADTQVPVTVLLTSKITTTPPVTTQTTTTATTTTETTTQQAVRSTTVQRTTPKLSKKELKKLERQRAKELARQRAKERQEARQLAKAKKAEEAKLARQKAKEERVARLKAQRLAKQQEQNLKRQQRKDALKLARQRIRARKLAARLALIAARKKAKEEKAAARRQSLFQERQKAIRERKLARQQATERQKAQKPNFQSVNSQSSRKKQQAVQEQNLSPEEIARRQNTFLNSLIGRK